VFTTTILFDLDPLAEHEDACLAEWYELDPLTGEAGCTLHSGWVRGRMADVRACIQARPLFDCIVSCYEAGPNGGERALSLI